MTVRVRIAPSPTGDPHVGTAYMALFNLIFAKHHAGKFILRIEDTDQSRSRKEYEENIYNSLHFCNIHWDEGPDVGGPYGPYRQSERLEHYQKAVNVLLDKAKAYKCFCTSQDLAEMREVNKGKSRQGYSRKCRNLSEEEIKALEAQDKPYVVRLKVPLTGTCEYVDEVKGKVTCPYADIDDQVLLKSDGFPTYHLANVVDDHMMEITHIIRGDEWMSSTPKHVLLYDCFGWEKPAFLHMPLLLGMDGKKLSKRKNPTSIFYYKDSGYLPEAFVNFLTLMGYSMLADQEIYSLDEIVETFDQKRIGLSGAVFDVQKLDWLNQQYIINCIPEDQLWDRIKAWSFSDEFMKKLIPLCHSRMKTFTQFMELFDFLFIQNLNLSDELLLPKQSSKELVTSILQVLLWELEKREDFSGQMLFSVSKELAAVFSVNHKKVIMPILFTTITGKQKGPPLFDSVDILGKHRLRARILLAIEFLGGISKKRLSQLEKSWKSEESLALVN